jgi:hypothetical protein
MVTLARFERTIATSSAWRNSQTLLQSPKHDCPDIISPFVETEVVNYGCTNGPIPLKPLGSPHYLV